MLQVKLAIGVCVIALTSTMLFSCSSDQDSDRYNSGQGTDSETSDNGTETETEPGFETSTDNDSDGFSPEDGDCNDGEAFINPSAIEDLGPDGDGDGVDNDCNGQTDEIVESCDCPDMGTVSTDLAKTIELCDSRFLISADTVFSSPGGTLGYGTMPVMGTNDCLFAQNGCEMAVISTGPVGQPNPNDAESMGGMGAQLANDPRPAFQGDQPSTGAKVESCDKTQLVLQLKAPTNAKGFSFDFLFGSAEYDEFLNLGYNDAFYAILEYDGLNNGQTTNIAFDDNQNEIEVDVNFFENSSHVCDETGSGWSPSVQGKSGTTGWLRTTWSIHPGAEFKLTFSVHDESDCIYDSIAFIDNFKWHTEVVEEGTAPL